MVHSPQRIASFIRGSQAVSALRVRDFRLFWLAGTAGSFGLNLWFLAAAWLVLELTDSQLQVGLVGGLAAVPSIVLVLLGGALSDRLDRRRLLVGALAVWAALATLTGALDAANQLQGWHVLLIAVGIGVADAVSNPARATLIVDLIGKQRLLAANALDQIGEFGGEVVAPLIVGVSILAVGPGLVFDLAGGMLVVGALLAAVMRQPRARQTPSADARLLRDIRAGLAYTRRTPPLPSLLALSATTLFGAAVIPLLPVYARDELEVGPEGFGVLAAALAAGMITGAVAMAARGEIPRRGPTIVVTRLIWFAAMAGFAVSTAFALSIVLLVVMGVAGAVGQNLIVTQLQARTADDMRGRVMTSCASLTRSSRLGSSSAGRWPPSSATNQDCWWPPPPAPSWSR